MTYRTGNHWGVTIVREATQPTDGTIDLSRDQLVAVVVNGDTALAERICSLLNFQDRAIGIWGPVDGDILAQPERVPLADSCTCSAEPDPDCVVHQGRKARGPKPSPLGPGCICDGSGRTCPRHGAVI